MSQLRLQTHQDQDQGHGLDQDLEKGRDLVQDPVPEEGPDRGQDEGRQVVHVNDLGTENLDLAGATVLILRRLQVPLLDAIEDVTHIHLDADTRAEVVQSLDAAVASIMTLNEPGPL